MGVLERFGMAFIPLVAVVTLPAVILSFLYVGLQAALVVGVVGWLLLLPASAILYGVLTRPGSLHNEIDQGVAEATMDDIQTEDPVEKLRQRYAEGDIDEQQLERGLDALLETEEVSVDDPERIERVIETLEDTKRDEAASDGPAAGTGDDREKELDRN